MTLRTGLLSLIISSLFLASCSLNYGKSENREESVPEFTFKNARYTKIEDSKVKTKITADKIEQYKSDGTSYASGTSFSTFNSDGEVETEGSCQILAADSKNEKYTLLNDIHLVLHSEDTEISAQALRYDGESEQIVSSAKDEVTIRRKDTTFTGKGFSASGVSHSFAFESDVSGSILTSDTQNDESDTHEDGQDEESAPDEKKSGDNE